MQIQNALLTGSTTVYGPITFVSGSIIGSSSYAATSSYADTFTVAGSLTAQTLVVQTITSSVSFITGSTRFGSLLTNTHTFTGSLQVTGSGPHTVFGNVQMGNNTSVGTTTPVILSLGGTFNSGTAGSNVKLRVYESSGDGSIGGMSVSSGQMEINTWSSGRIAFYRGTTQTAVFDAGGSLGIGTATPLSRLHVETSSISNGNILTLRNSAAWSTPMMTSIAIRDSSNDVGAIGWRYNAAGTTVDMHIHSLYNSAYTNINNIVMTVRGNGNVGIGTVLPNALLHVSGSGSGSLMQISSHVSSSIFFVSGSGNVGIGTTTPSARLQVIAPESTSGLDSFGVVGQNNLKSIQLGATSSYAWIQSHGSVPLRINELGNNVLIAVGGASVGIGTSNPQHILHLQGSGTTYLHIGNSSTGTGSSDGADIGYFTGQTSLNIVQRENDAMIFSTNDTERMRITSAGIVCVGGTSQLGSSTLSAFGSVAARNSGVDASYVEAFTAYYSANNTESNAILTSVSTTAQNSGFRFDASNGAGSAARTAVLTLTRSGAKLLNGASYLNYYEEGTWTPAFAQAGTPSYTTQFGRYTRIGNMVYCTIALRATSVSGASTIQITGLPFTPGDASDTGQRATYNPRLGGHINGLTESTAKFRITGGTTMEGVKGDGDTTFMTAAQFTSGGSIQLTGQFWYYV